MQTITIIPSENSVYVNGERREVDCSKLDQNIHAIQWCHCPKRNKSKGHIEWVQDPLEAHKLNTPIESMDQFQKVVDAWELSPDEETRCKRIRADKQVARVEEALKNCRAEDKECLSAELSERKKQRDEVYSGKRKEVNPSGAL